MSDLHKPLTRGELSKHSGVNPETIRYYEKIGLMPLPERSQGGHRLYGETESSRLAFVRRCRELGFSLAEIRDLLALVDGGNYSCADIRERTARHLDDINEKICDLKRMQRTLRRMVASCDADEVPECPVVESLFRA